MLSPIPFHLNQPGTADLPAWYLTRAFCWLAEGSRRPANSEREFGKMEALLTMKMGACGQWGKDSAPGFLWIHRQGADGLQGTSGSLDNLALETCFPLWYCHSHRKLLSTSELLIPHR